METTKPKMRLKLSYPTQNSAKGLIDASSKKKLQRNLKAKVNGWLRTVNWESTYSLLFWCSKETKLREFQFKPLHRRIATNDFLYKIGIKQSDSCTFCGEPTENLVHLFWSCKFSNAFWKDCYQWIINAKHLQGRTIQPLRSSLIWLN